MRLSFLQGIQFIYSVKFYTEFYNWILDFESLVEYWSPVWLDGLGPKLWDECETSVIDFEENSLLECNETVGAK